MLTRRGILFFVFTIVLTLWAYSQHQQRFPRPEFETGYEQPDATTPEPRSGAVELIDVLVLTLALGGGAWLALKKRSRKGILWLSIFSLAYFGFFREGCICSVGSLQNIALSLFDPGYAVSLNVLAFFVIPLISALFFGRIFCGSVCPLGVIQDLVVLKPVKLPHGVQTVLGLLPFIYLGFAVLFAATGTDFIICRYDPFVGIFRLGAPFHMIILGVLFLLIGMFVSRPYCRFLCPYGVLLGWMSRFSRRHLTITPAECIECKLCADSCPFDAIEAPTGDLSAERTSKNRNRFIVYAILIPVMAFATGFLLNRAHPYLAKANSTVYLADLLVTQPEMQFNTENLDISTFMASGKSLSTLTEEADAIRHSFAAGSWYLGIFLGLVFGFTLLNQVIYRRREGYTPHKGDCVSCGRCFDYCPVQKHAENTNHE